MSSATPSQPPQQPARRRDRRETARTAAALVVGALIAAFAVLNFHDVRVNWILGTWSTPLILVIAVSFLLGVAAGLLGPRLRRRARRRAAARRP